MQSHLKPPLRSCLSCPPCLVAVSAPFALWRDITQRELSHFPPQTCQAITCAPVLSCSFPTLIAQHQFPLLGHPPRWGVRRQWVLRCGGERSGCRSRLRSRQEQVVNQVRMYLDAWMAAQPNRDISGGLSFPSNGKAEGSFSRSAMPSQHVVSILLLIISRSPVGCTTPGTVATAQARRSRG